MLIMMDNGDHILHFKHNAKSFNVPFTIHDNLMNKKYFIILTFLIFYIHFTIILSRCIWVVPTHMRQLDCISCFSGFNCHGILGMNQISAFSF